MITSALLIAGMWVPYAASAQAIVELCSCWDGRGVAVIHLVQTALALSLAMFGRRASLLDLQLFKRKRVDLRIVGR
jgi:hypothetical protein